MVLAERDGIVCSRKEVTMPVVYRLFKLHDRKAKANEAPDIRRFEAPACNDLWEIDALHGPKCIVRDGESRHTVVAKLFVVIDQRSRLVTNAAFYPDESAESLIDCLWNAFSMRGLPRKCLTDNGAAMRDLRIRLGCADLGVQLTYCKPYKPRGKGCVERFNLTVRMQFLPLLPKEPLDLFELNRRWEKYMDEYNRRVHSSLGIAPLQCYLSEVGAVRPAPRDLPSYFRRKETRTVSKARTIRLDNILFQVPLGYSGRKIDLRFNDTDDVEAFCDGKSLGRIHPVDLHANYKSHRIPEGKGAKQ
jgi:transposase InsO family protein